MSHLPGQESRCWARGRAGGSSCATSSASSPRSRGRPYSLRPSSRARAARARAPLRRRCEGCAGRAWARGRVGAGVRTVGVNVCACGNTPCVLARAHRARMMRTYAPHAVRIIVDCVSVALPGVHAHNANIAPTHAHCARPAARRARRARDWPAGVAGSAW